MQYCSCDLRLHWAPLRAEDLGAKAERRLVSSGESEEGQSGSSVLGAHRLILVQLRRHAGSEVNEAHLIGCQGCRTQHRFQWQDAV